MDKNKSGIYCTPDGKGKQTCAYWEDWLKYKYTKPELWWTEKHEILIFPDCMRKEEEEEDDDSGI